MLNAESGYGLTTSTPGPNPRKELIMLVLSRHRDERIVVKLPDGRVVRITIVEIRGDKAKVGIEADRDIEIVREELLSRHA